MSASEILVVLPMLLRSRLLLAGIKETNVSLLQRTCDSNVNSRTVTIGPSGESDIIRTATSARTENACLLKHR